MAVESLFERYGARKHERLAGLVFECATCSGDVHRSPAQCAILARSIANPQRASVGTGKLFCSRSCQDTFWDAYRQKAACENCGAAVVRPPSQMKKSVFCSKACAANHGIEAVSCHWPGCQAIIKGRRVVLSRNIPAWKIDLRRNGAVATRPICGAHQALVAEHLPGRSRLQIGKALWLDDPSSNIGTRGISSDITKLMVWAKTGGRCADCGCALSMSEKPRRWNIDHIIPVFRGGLTTYGNLAPLCGPCHVIKSAPERSEASKNKARTKFGRGLTHPEKDAVIASLREEVAALRVQLAAIRDHRDGIKKRQCRRISERA